MTSIPAPRRVIHLEPMTRVSNKEFKRGMVNATKDTLAFIALATFIATLFIVAALINVPTPGV